MSDDSVHTDPFDRLADEFVARYRRGERPAVAEYCNRHPDMADDIRRVFPTLVVMERVRPAGTDSELTARDGVVAADLMPERLGDYRLLREIGRGGMGIVYEAEQESLGRHVALKVLPMQAVLDPRHLQRFQREARAAARLHHTNIVPVFGVGERDGLYYYVMQFIAGLGLDKVLDEVRWLRGPHKPEAQARENQEHTLARQPTIADVPRDQDSGRLLNSVDARHPRSIGPTVLAASPSAAQLAAVLMSGSRISGNESSSLHHEFEQAQGDGSKPQRERVDFEVAKTKPVPPLPDVSDTTAFRVRHPFSDGSGSGINLLEHDGTSLSHPGLQYWHGVARIGVQVAEAIDYAIGQGVLHRDIKPSNLLLDTHGTVWVTDFGLAKAADSDDLTHTGDIVGTLRYLAPERLRGESDVRSDIYGLGATLYEMIALRPPFQDHDRGRLLRSIANDEPPPPREIDGTIPHDLETIVMKAVAKEPADRYQSAAELASDLRQFLDDKPIAARPIGSVERFVRWRRRNPVVARLTVAVAALLVAVAAISTGSAVYMRRLATRETAARVSAEAAERLADAERNRFEEQRRIAVANEALANRRFYTAQMNLAGQALERGELARVLDLLESQRPQSGETDLRGFEWFYLWREIHRALHVSFRQTEGEVWCLAFSPDGTALAVGGKSDKLGALKLWDVATGELQAALDDDGQDTVAGAEFSPDGKFLASGSADSLVRVWDVAAQRVTVRIDAKIGVRSLRWSRDGALIAVGCQDGSVRIFDAASFELKASLNEFNTPVLGLAFSADGKQLVSAVAWGAPNQRTLIHDLTTAPPRLLHDLKDRFVTDAVPDGDSVASYEGGVLRVWDPSTRTDQTQITTNAGWLNNVRFSPDAQRIATAGFEDRLATLWDCDSGQPVVRGPHAQAIQVVAFDPSRRFWASASIDGEVKIWLVDVPNENMVIEHEPVIEHVFVPSETATLILGGEFPANGRDIESGEPRHVPPVQHLRAISADGRVLAAAIPPAQEPAGWMIEVWDADSSRPRYSWPLPDSTKLFSECIALSENGRLLATRSWERPIRIWDLSGDEPRQTHELVPGDCRSLAFSPDARLLVAACQHGHVRLWDVETGQALPNLQDYESGSAWSNRVCFSRDGARVAAGNTFGVVQVWDVRTARLLATLRGHLGEIGDLLFFPDGRRLAVASLEYIRLWDVDTGQELLTLNVPAAQTIFLAVTPDGRNLISRDNSGAVRIWKSRPRGPSP